MAANEFTAFTYKGHQHYFECDPARNALVHRWGPNIASVEDLRAKLKIAETLLGPMRVDHDVLGGTITVYTHVTPSAFGRTRVLLFHWDGRVWSAKVQEH
jgi:hypothetical protein